MQPPPPTDLHRTLVPISPILHPGGAVGIGHWLHWETEVEKDEILEITKTAIELAWEPRI